MNPTDNGKLYFPPGLTKSIAAISHQPLTFITAGSGFGKTTAVSAALERLPRTTLYRWYTCFGEPPERAWAGLCRLISFVDPHIGDYLAKLELPSADNLGYISSLMEEISCQHETVLIIDNYQLADFPAPHLLLDALAAHRCPQLHIVVLSHPIYKDDLLFPANPRIFQIRQTSFCFSPSDVQKLFALYKAELNGSNAKLLCEVTEGWVAALRLHLASFLAGNGLRESSGLNELLEQAFWRRLNAQEQDLFLGLSLLDTFTEAQAARMLGQEMIPATLWSAVRRNAFVRTTGNEYTLHNLLKEFLTAKFQTLPEKMQRQLRRRAGVASRLQEKNLDALLFFVSAGDDAAALSVPLTSLELAELVRTKTEILTELLSRCNINMLSDRWLLLLGTAVKASLNSKAALARSAVMRLTELRTQEALTPEQSQYAAAALELVASFSSYNDLKKMCHHHAATIAMLDDANDFYLTNDSWTFCIPSVVYMFWREPGQLTATTELLRQGIPNYALLSGGKGLGGPEAMAAEAMLLAGEEQQCATLTYQARTIAKNNGQDSILFCTRTLLARLALLRGDAAAFTNSIEEIRRLAFAGQEFLCVTASEIALGFLYSLIEQDDKIPHWLTDGDRVRETLYPISIPFAHIVTLRSLSRQTPEELPGTAEAYIAESTALHHLLPRLYFLLEEATFYERNGQRKQAVEKLNEVLALSLPDRVYLPIAEYYDQLSGVFSDPSLLCPDMSAVERICALGRRFVSGTAAVRAALTEVSPLTPREREIALLAQSRLSTREIAAQLSVSPATVKNTLNKVYSKLNVNGKTQLRNVRL